MDIVRIPKKTIDGGEELLSKVNEIDLRIVLFVFVKQKFRVAVIRWSYCH